jgi:putative transposase
MPDHVHLFCRPAWDPRMPIKRWCTYLKERTSKRLRSSPADGSPQVRPPPGACFSHMEGEAGPSRTPWRWQPDCWDTQVRCAAHYHERWEYVAQNPVRKNLVRLPQEWPWQGTLHALEW